MKIPQLFGKTPKHQRFAFQPRYYDAQKEERDERNRRILLELERDKKNQTNAEEYQPQIKGSFQSARKRSQISAADLRTSLIRLAIILLLVLFAFGWLYFGNKVVYGFAAFIPLYIWYRFKR